MGYLVADTEFINRDCIRRTVTYDGQRITLEPNYDEKGTLVKGVVNKLPKLFIPFALNQNVVMGSEDAIDPSGFESYVVPKIFRRKHGKNTAELRYDISFRPSKGNKATTRVDLETYLDNPSLKVVEGRGKFRASEAGVSAGSTGIANQSINDE